MRLADCLAASFLALFMIAPASAMSAPRHASSRPAVRHPVTHKSTAPPGNRHSKRGHFVATPGTRKHHKWL
jgi:hypothetical protein